jgi:hypothetical protein
LGITSAYNPSQQPTNTIIPAQYGNFGMTSAYNPSQQPTNTNIPAQYGNLGITSAYNPSQQPTHNPSQFQNRAPKQQNYQPHDSTKKWFVFFNSKNSILIFYILNE